MYKRTFEVLAKYISKANGVTIQFDMDGGAKADMKRKILHLPKKIANKHAYAAVSLMMHEAAHIKHSSQIPIKDIVKTKAEFSILNAIEDVRIDNKNFKLLPNIWEFYKELYKEVEAEAKKHRNIPVHNRALCYAILRLENFRTSAYGHDAMLLGSRITNRMNSSTIDIALSDWINLRKNIIEIKKILGIKDDTPLTPKEIEKLQIGDPVDGPLGNVEKLLHPGKIFAQTDDDLTGGSATQTGALAMEEQCINQFKEILNQKERKVISDGTILDTSSLVSYGTGDVATLFKEEKTIRKKKSKVMFLLDGSGSMNAPLLDNQARITVVKKAVKKLTEILDEVALVEGVGVDWGIGMFRRRYYPLEKHNWPTMYMAGGGTEFDGPFIQVMNELIEDYTIDGKKIIIAITDGDVSEHEIDRVKSEIISKYNDVRALLIGVGATGSCAFVKELTGDNIILAEENAVPVILETIKAML